MSPWTVLVASLTDKPENHPVSKTHCLENQRAATEAARAKAAIRKQERWEAVRAVLGMHPAGRTLDELVQDVPYTKTYLSNILNRMMSKGLVRFTKAMNSNVRHWKLS
jgi:hypothetical protein